MSKEDIIQKEIVPLIGVYDCPKKPTSPLLLVLVIVIALTTIFGTFVTASTPHSYTLYPMLLLLILVMFHTARLPQSERFEISTDSVYIQYKGHASIKFRHTEVVGYLHMFNRKRSTFFIIYTDADGCNICYLTHPNETFLSKWISAYSHMGAKHYAIYPVHLLGIKSVIKWGL